MTWSKKLELYWYGMERHPSQIIITTLKFKTDSITRQVNIWGVGRLNNYKNLFSQNNVNPGNNHSLVGNLT